MNVTVNPDDFGRALRQATERVRQWEQQRQENTMASLAVAGSAKVGNLEVIPPGEGNRFHDVRVNGQSVEWQQLRLTLNEDGLWEVELEFKPTEPAAPDAGVR